jgi:hypothetical protein
VVIPGIDTARTFLLLLRRTASHWRAAADFPTTAPRRRMKLPRLPGASQQAEDELVNVDDAGFFIQAADGSAVGPFETEELAIDAALNQPERRRTFVVMHAFTVKE